MLSLFKKKPPFMGDISGIACPLSRQSTLLDSILAEGLDMPYSCQVGACRKCLVRVNKGQVNSLIDLGFILSNDQIAEGYVLACQAIPKSDLQLDFVQDVCVASRTSGTLVGMEPLNDYVFRVTLSTSLVAQVGQSVMVTIPVLGQSRFYSIAGVGNGEIVLDVARQENGVCSTWLTDSYHLAQTVELGEPTGQFGQVASFSECCVAIAGGSALGMVLGVVEQRIQANPAQRVTLIHAVRIRTHAYDLERLERMRSTYAGFEYLIALSRDVYDEGQFVATRAPDLLRARFQTKTVPENYLMCGSDSLIKSCIDVLKNHLVEMHQWEAESFGSHSI